MYYKVKLNPVNKAEAKNITKDGYLGWDETTPAIYTRGEAIKKSRVFDGKIELIPYTKELVKATITQIPNSLLLNEVKGMLNGRGEFIDNTSNNEVMYHGDIFISLASELRSMICEDFYPKDTIMNQLNELSQIVTTDYVQITNS